VPEQLRKRTLAVRGFDGNAMMTGWELIEGVKLEEAIERQFANPRTSYLHVHFAAPGCYAATHRAGVREALFQEIVGAQYHGPVGPGVLLEKLDRGAVLDDVAQPQKLIDPLFRLHGAAVLEIIHGRGADRADDGLVRVVHREIDHHPVEIVALHSPRCSGIADTPCRRGPLPASQ